MKDTTMTMATDRRWRADEDTFLITTNSTLSVREQAATLERPYGSTLTRRWSLIRAGMLDPTARKTYRPWTATEDQQLLELLRDGASLPVIATRLNRSRLAVLTHCDRLGGIEWLRYPSDGVQVRRIKEVARLFGVDPKTVDLWVRRKWLEGKRTSRKRAAHTLISDLALTVFLANWRAWYTWEPEQITDPDWRTQALWERKRSTQQWLSAAAAGQRAGVHRKTIWRAVVAQQLPAQRFRHCYFVWSVDLDKWLQQRKARA